MSTQDEDGVPYWVVAVGIPLIMIAGCVMGAKAQVSISNEDWQKKAIQHGAAYYDPETGQFQWKTTDGESCSVKK